MKRTSPDLMDQPFPADSFTSRSNASLRCLKSQLSSMPYEKCRRAKSQYSDTDKQKINPVILCAFSSNSVITDFLFKQDCVIRIAAEDPQEIASGARMLLQMTQEERERLGANGSRYARQYHDYCALAKQFAAACAGEETE